MSSGPEGERLLLPHGMPGGRQPRRGVQGAPTRREGRVELVRAAAWPFVGRCTGLEGLGGKRVRKVWNAVRDAEMPKDELRP